MNRVARRLIRIRALRAARAVTLSGVLFSIACEGDLENLDPSSGTAQPDTGASDGSNGPIDDRGFGPVGDGGSGPIRDFGVRDADSGELPSDGTCDYTQFDRDPDCCRDDGGCMAVPGPFVPPSEERFV